LLYHTITENNIHKNKKVDTKNAGKSMPANTFSVIQLSNSRKWLINPKLVMLINKLQISYFF
ncbi:MAG: hypothetical protein UHU19_04800, partial [Lachnospiraceae bacterium]|nr:hypothetical protein [Lachnospiraceae bacterium]